MSLRLRLTLWYALVLCLGLAAFAAAVVWQTQRSASADLDHTLRQRAQDVAADLVVGQSIVLRADAPDESGRQPGETTLWIRVLDAHGRVVVRQGPVIPGVSPRVLATVQPGFQQWASPGERMLRVFIQPVTRHGRRVATIQVITTMDQLETARRQLLAAMGIAGVVIVLVATLGGLLLAASALRPVDRITRLAERIGTGNLHRRVKDEAGDASRRNDELGRLARTFDAMLDRLEEGDERRRQLTADVAHELCTPIATISSSAEIALRHPRSAEGYSETLRHILDESRHMGRVVDDLLLLARADAGNLPMQRELVELDEVCRQVAAAMRPLAAERGVTLVSSVPPEVVLVMGDEMRLAQVMRNLLDNALHYTPTGGTVTFALSQEQATNAGGPGHTVVLRVRDTGPGIPAEERERVFERFHRVAGPSSAVLGAKRRLGGSGLGLAICKAIVEAHGGHVGVENAADGVGGACFTVTLPGVA